MQTPVPESIPVGAHLATPRRGYVHHGIYIGGGRVIHYGGFAQAWRAMPVQEVSLEQFSRGHEITVRPWPAPAFAGEAVLWRARSRLGENRYSLLLNNCEHFVEWCIGGRARSRQVERWLRPCLWLLAPLVTQLSARLSTRLSAQLSGRSGRLGSRPVERPFTERLSRSVSWALSRHAAA